MWYFITGLIVGILGTLGICCLMGGAMASEYEERQAQALKEGPEIYFGFKKENKPNGPS
jgi:hypothetical protein